MANLPDTFALREVLDKINSQAKYKPHDDVVRPSVRALDGDEPTVYHAVVNGWQMVVRLQSVFRSESCVYRLGLMRFLGGPRWLCILVIPGFAGVSQQLRRHFSVGFVLALSPRHHTHIPPYAAATIARCQCLQQSAGSPLNFYDRTGNDRFVPELASQPYQEREDIDEIAQRGAGSGGRHSH